MELGDEIGLGLHLEPAGDPAVGAEPLGGVVEDLGELELVEVDARLEVDLVVVVDRDGAFDREAVMEELAGEVDAPVPLHVERDLPAAEERVPERQPDDAEAAGGGRPVEAAAEPEIGAGGAAEGERGRRDERQRHRGELHVEIERPRRLQPEAAGDVERAGAVADVEALDEDPLALVEDEVRLGAVERVAGEAEIAEVDVEVAGRAEQRSRGGEVEIGAAVEETLHPGEPAEIELGRVELDPVEPGPAAELDGALARDRAAERVGLEPVHVEPAGAGRVGVGHAGGELRHHRHAEDDGVGGDHRSVEGAAHLGARHLDRLGQRRQPDAREHGLEPRRARLHVERDSSSRPGRPGPRPARSRRGA